jgi:D-amino peptidase
VRDDSPRSLARPATRPVPSMHRLRFLSVVAPRARWRRILSLAVAAAIVTLPLSAHAQRGLKVYISADLEGIAGVVTGDQLGPTGFEYGRAREFMTGEVLAAIAAAREAGATEIVVSDSHGNGESLLIDQFPDDVRIVRSWPRPLMMMEGIDSTFHAAILIGYHSGTTNQAGVRAHTISSANYAGVSLNGVVVPEGGLSAAIAGRFGVPVVLVSGDDVAVEEVRRLLGDVEGAVVKRAVSFHSAMTMTPKAAQALIRERVKAALARRSSFKPYVVRAPVQLDLTFKNYRPAEILAYLPIVQRTTAHSIRFTGRDMVEVSKFLQFLGTYEPGIAP